VTLVPFVTGAGRDSNSGIPVVAKISLEISLIFDNHQMMPQLPLPRLNGKFRAFFNTLALKMCWGMHISHKSSANELSTYLPQEFCKVN
jgi:hypothetical protein